MDFPVPQILTSIVTSGVMSAIVSGYFTARREEKDLLREKLEVLDAAVTRFCELHEKQLRQCIVSGNDFTMTKGTLDPEEKKEHDRTLNTIRMLISMYFPQLDEALNRLYSTMEDMKASWTFPGPEMPQAMVNKIDRAKESWEYDEANMHSEISKVARAQLTRNLLSFGRWKRR